MDVVGCWVGLVGACSWHHVDERSLITGHDNQIVLGLFFAVTAVAEKISNVHYRAASLLSYVNGPRPPVYTLEEKNTKRL